MRRREFMRTAGGATVAAGATAGAVQPATAAESGGGGSVEPAFGTYLDNANQYESTEDLRDQDEVTVAVGAGDGLAFDPAAIWISPGTTVTWEWTGEGGSHNVVVNNGPAGFTHEEIVGEGGYTYEYEFTEEDAGITTYYCAPHEGQGMKGGVAVGDDVETVSTGGNIKEPVDFGVHPHEHWVGVSVMLMMSVSLIFTFFTLKYGESPHTSGGD